MGNPKFTSGPWSCGARLSGSENHKGYLITSNAWPLAEVFPVDRDGLVGRANGDLIAAAPDLYRELSRLVGLMEILERDGGLDIPGLATLNGPRAALAKAEGK